VGEVLLDHLAQDQRGGGCEGGGNAEGGVDWIGIKMPRSTSTMPSGCSERPHGGKRECQSRQDFFVPILNRADFRKKTGRDDIKKRAPAGNKAKELVLALLFVTNRASCSDD